MTDQPISDAVREAMNQAFPGGFSLRDEANTIVACGAPSATGRLKICTPENIRRYSRIPN